jgi:hypothetical protein
VNLIANLEVVLKLIRKALVDVSVLWPFYLHRFSHMVCHLGQSFGQVTSAKKLFTCIDGLVFSIWSANMLYFLMLKNLISEWPKFIVTL